MTNIDSQTRLCKGFRFFLYNDANPVEPDSEIWLRSLPMTRKDRNIARGRALTLGAYFMAVASFLKRDSYRVLKKALSRQDTSRLILDEGIPSIQVYLEKHGEFYHPSRVTVTIAGRRLSFVLNVAVSERGRNLMAREYANLERLGNQLCSGDLPAVYGMGIGITGAVRLPMFLGQWFEGFHEFHLTRTPAGKQAVVVWDTVNGNFYLTPDQTRKLYREATRLLTRCFNPDTSEHVFPWHHAAGDFVVRLCDHKPELRLITVRGYDPLNAGPEGDAVQDRLETLLVFFLLISIRMRLDRRDGIREMVWAEDDYVPEILNGFLEELQRLSSGQTGVLPLRELFAYYLISLEENELITLAETLVEKYHASTWEYVWLKDRVSDHCRRVRQALAKRYA